MSFAGCSALAAERGASTLARVGYVEFTIEPFVEGSPGPHVTAAIDAARRNSGRFVFDASTVVAPSYTGVRTFDRIDLAELVPYFDWTPFFHAWGLRGRYPSILDHEELGEAAVYAGRSVVPAGRR